MSRLGTNDCAHCGEESYPWEPWPSCRSCVSETCDRCQAKASEAGDDGHISVLCKACDVPSGALCRAAYDGQHGASKAHPERCQFCGDRMPMMERIGA